MDTGGAQKRAMGRSTEVELTSSLGCQRVEDVVNVALSIRVRGPSHSVVVRQKNGPQQLGHVIYSHVENQSMLRLSGDLIYLIFFVTP